MTKLKTRIAGITAATMTAAALTATVAAPAMANTAADCAAVVAATTDPNVEVVAPELATIDQMTVRRAVTYTVRIAGTDGHMIIRYNVMRDLPGRVMENTLALDGCTQVNVSGGGFAPIVTVLVSLPDTDGDGVLDADDRFPNSVMTPTVVLGDQDTGVVNTVSDDGATLADLFAEALASDDAKADKKAAKSLLKALEDGDAISKDDKKALKSAVKDLEKAEKDAAKA